MYLEKLKALNEESSKLMAEVDAIASKPIDIYDHPEIKSRLDKIIERVYEIQAEVAKYQWISNLTVH